MTPKRGDLLKELRRSAAYDQWKRMVLIRDRFTCQACGARNGRKRIIEVHHLTEFSDLITKNSITSLEQGLQTPALWDVDNGQTLCCDCHKKTDSYPKGLAKVTPKKNMSGWYGKNKPTPSSL